MSISLTRFLADLFASAKAPPKPAATRKGKNGRSFYHAPSRIPDSVVLGCKKGAPVVVDDRQVHATNREGAQLFRFVRTMNGPQKVPTTQPYRAVSRDIFKKHLNELRRARAGRHVGTFPTYGKEARLAAS